MSVKEKQDELVENFSFFDEWEDKYSFLIGMAKSLPPYPDTKKDDAHFVKGCQSQVWFDAEHKEGCLYFIGTSDAMIVSGLIGMLVEVYSGQKADDIANSDTDFLKEIGLDSHLSATRNNGLHAMVQNIYATAQRYAA
ncbi:SufE family protein [Francisellaceae bacterium]|nr:SufE family protein [Francisellaceae bacterium]